MLETVTLGGWNTGLRPVNVIMATLLWGACIPLVEKALREVRDE